MAELPPNPDLMLIPQDAPQLILSAETSFSMPALAQSMDIYAEHFRLDRDLVVKNKSEDPKQKSRLGLFVKSFSTSVPKDKEVLKIDLGGADGTDTSPNALSGGQVACFIQQLDQKSVDTFNIDVYGGHGYDQIHSTSGASPAGGNGGTGGQLSFAFGSAVSTPLILARQLENGVKNGVLKYPADATDPLKQLSRRCQDKDVQSIAAVTEALKTLDKFPNLKQGEFIAALVDMILIFAEIERHMKSRVLQSVGVRGGKAGVGIEGKGDKGGQPGNDGKATVTYFSDPKTLWDVEMCFAHPTQCNMMLEKAKSRYYAGTPNPSNAQEKDKPSPLGEAKAVLENLLDRLQFLDDNHQPKDITKSILFSAYKVGDATLSIPVDGKKDGFPASLSQLISIRKEAIGLYAQLDSGLDAFNDSLNSVPTRSFGSYEESLNSSIEYLIRSESLYKGYKEAADKSEANKAHIKKSRDATEAALAYNAGMDRDILVKLKDTKANIERFDYPLSRAKTSLTAAVNEVKEELQNVISFPFEELVNAASQIMFVNKWPMGALQGISLYNQVTNKVIQDDGTSVDRKFLVRKVTNIIGSLESLDEGYKMLSDGTLQDQDPDASKLMIEQDEFSKLMGEVSNSLKDETVNKVKTYFKFYITLVTQRGQEIMTYNALVATLVRYRTESESLKQKNDELQLADIASIDVHHPVIVAFMQKLYVNALRTTQYWLYKAQRAYNYDALNYDNVIGEVLGEDVPFSRFDSTLLSAAAEHLTTSYKKYLEGRGPARSYFKSIKVPLDDWEHIPTITESGRESCTFFVKLAPGPGANGEPDPFVGMANVRLLRARCYLQGAVCKSSNMLHLTLTHAGGETLVDTTARKYEFQHKVQIVSAFKYHLDTQEVEFETTIGEKREDSGYALVGPFVTWRVDIEKSYNPGMDLSGVTSGYLEFEGYFEPIP